MERRLGIMQSVEPVLENAIKTLQKVVDVRGMGKKALIQLQDEEAPAEAPAKAAKAADKDPEAAATTEEKKEILKAKDSDEVMKQAQKEEVMQEGL